MLRRSKLGPELLHCLLVEAARILRCRQLCFQLRCSVLAVAAALLGGCKLRRQPRRQRQLLPQLVLRSGQAVFASLQAVFCGLQAQRQVRLRLPGLLRRTLRCRLQVTA